MSKRHFSCWNERTRADFHVYRQHCTKDKKKIEAGKKNKKKIKLFQIPKMPGTKEKRTTTESVRRLKGDNSCDIPVGCTGWFTPQQGGYPEESINTSKCSFSTLLPLGHPPRDPHSARAGVLVFRMITFYFINIQLTFCCELKWIKPLIWELRSFPAQQFM